MCNLLIRSRQMIYLLGGDWNIVRAHAHQMFQSCSVCAVKSLIGLIAAFFLFSGASSARPLEDIERWAKEISLGPEFGGDGNSVSKWTRSPTLSVFGATVSQLHAVYSSVANINEALAETKIKEIKLLTPENSRASIKVYLLRSDEMPFMAEEIGFPYHEGNDGYFWAYWRRNAINRAYVFLASDKLSGPDLRHFALEEITQTLGLMSDSQIFDESIFFSGRSRSQELTRLDKELIKFFYNHLDHGDREHEFHQAFSQHWKSLP